MFYVNCNRVLFANTSIQLLSPLLFRFFRSGYAQGEVCPTGWEQGHRI